LHHILDVCDANNAAAHVWNTLKEVTLTHVLPLNAVLALDVWDPRLRFGVKMNERTPTGACSDELKQLQLDWPLNVSQSNLTNPEHRQHITETMQPKRLLDERRKKRLIPGLPLDPTTKDSRVPILLVQKRNGWDLILPEGWARAFWMSLVFAGAKVGGLESRELVAFEHGEIGYPCDSLGTPAFTDHVYTYQASLQISYDAKPASKRVNYDKLNFKHPFEPAFHTLVAGEPWLLRGMRLLSEYLGNRQDDENAFVPVRLYLPKRVPKYAACIYAVNEEDLAEIIVRYKPTKDTASVDSLELEEYQAPLNVKPGEAIGFVTSGNHSLERGLGFGIALLKLAAARHMLPTSSQPVRNVVLIRNPNAETCIPAFVELILERDQ
jgi:hypothetical protein